MCSHCFSIVLFVGLVHWDGQLQLMIVCPWYRWELGGKSPEEFPMRFHKMIMEEKLFDDVENGVNACFVISAEQKGGTSPITMGFWWAKGARLGCGRNVFELHEKD